MDPTIKVIKGGNNDNKSTGGGGITMAVRFNAGDEQIEDILIKPSSTPIATTTTTTTSIDFSPIQNIEDFNWRKEFLSSNFFHRKRSGSIEGDQRNNINSNINISSSSSPNSSIINNLSNNDTTNAVGTWKLIKGKVSQAMEDINWPKNQSQQQQQQQHSLSTKSYPSNNDDSDLDSTINSSISDELSLDTPSQSVIYTGQNQQQQQQQSQILNKINQQQKLFNFNRINNKSDSESDIDQDVLTIDDYEPSTIRKSLANLRSKAKSSLINNDNNYNNNNNNNNKKDDNNLITSNTIRNPFLRKRKKHDNDQINLTNTIINNIPSNNITTDKENINEKDIIIDKKLNDNNKNININNNNKKKNKRHFENIESGIEMFEDMIIIDKKDLLNNKNIINEAIINDKLINNNGCEDGLLKISLNNDTIIYKNNNNNNNSGCVNQINNNNNDNNNSNDNNNINNNINIKNNIIKNSNLFIIFIFLFILILIPINDFLRGIITCLFTIQLFNIIWEYIKIYIDYKLNPSLNNINNSINDDNNCFGNGNGPEKIKFEIPNYNKMKYFELSSNIEEHKPLKSYSGWMNEINNYDPANYHISLTRSVYIRLDGSILRISNTSTRIPKRSMWNEHNIDRKNIIFTSNRCFNLLGCRVEMLPRGLARKRYFSRKYPIQLVIKNHDKLSATNNLEDDLLKNSIFEKALRLTTQQIESGKIISGSISNNEHFNETIINKDCSNLENNGISNELNDEQRNNNSDYQLSNDFDFSTIILNSDLQKLSENQNLLPNNNNNNTNKNLLPCGDETRILLFARDDREKEDWYRRFYSASIGAINDQELCISDIVMISDDDIAQAVKATTKTINDSELTTTADITNLPENIDNPSTSKLLKNSSKTIKKNNTISSNNTTTTDNNILINDYFSEQQQNNDIDGQATIFEGLLLSSCSARNPQEYIKFMSRYQKACSQSNIPVVKTSLIPTDSSIKRNRRQKRQEDELWKGIDQTLYLGPCGSVVWANVLIGRILFSCLNDTILLGRIQEFLQKKLSAIRLPSFMEDVSIAQVHLGDTPPLIHRISQPQLDERGIWIDADVTYEGLMHMTITTKLNLLRLKRSQQHQQTSSINHHNKSSSSSNIGGNTNKLNTTQSTTTTASNPSIINQNGNNNRNSITTPTKQNNINNGNIDITSTIINNENLEPNNYNLLIDDNNCGNNTINLNENNDNSINYNSSINNNYNEPIITTTTTTTLPNSAIYDSNAESSGASSSDSESPTPIGSFDSTLTTNDSQGFHHPAPGSSRRLLRIVDRITASNLFQSATEISYIQRAMENMSTKITLRVELKGLVSRVVINIPPPPSDRIWIAFRGPPRLWISAKPAVGDHTFDWSIVTNVIENKLCDEVYKYLVYPNMVDIIVPFLGQSTYKEE